MWFDIDHAPRALGWSPRWSTDEMFAQSYDWFVANRADVDDQAASRHRRTARQGILTGAKRLTRVLPLAAGDDRG